MVIVPYLPNLSARAGYDTRSVSKRSLTGLNSEFSFSYTSCLIKAKEYSLSYYLPIAGGRIIGFIPFPRVLVQCEMRSVSSRIWTRVAVSISYDDNQYTTGTSIYGNSTVNERSYRRLFSLFQFTTTCCLLWVIAYTIIPILIQLNWLKIFWSSSVGKNPSSFMFS